MATYQARISEFETALQCDVIDFKNIQKLSFSGCPHEKSIRSKCWKVLLNYLPKKTAEWESYIAKQRKQYKHFVDEMILKPGSERHKSGDPEVTIEDHPLNPNPDSTWSQYFRDNEALVQIDKDCRRLYPDLSFFQNATPYPCEELVDLTSNIETLRQRVELSVLKAQNVCKSRSGTTIADYKRSRRAHMDDLVVLNENQEAHWEVVERALFIYVKLNPGQGYVQGMNEIIGPIYYTMSSDPSAEVQKHAEADTFWCFTHLMAEIRDNFIKQLDDNPACGIGMLMQKLLDTLKEKDTALWCRLNQQDLKPQYFAFRWLTLLLSQEFPLPDVLRVWDSLLSDSHRFDFLIYVCCSMLILLRDDLLKGDFPTNMKMIQNYPNPDVGRILARAVELANR